MGSALACWYCLNTTDLVALLNARPYYLMMVCFSPYWILNLLWALDFQPGDFQQIFNQPGYVSIPLRVFKFKSRLFNINLQSEGRDYQPDFQNLNYWPLHCSSLLSPFKVSGPHYFSRSNSWTQWVMVLQHFCLCTLMVSYGISQKACRCAF